MQSSSGKIPIDSVAVVRELMDRRPFAGAAGEWITARRGERPFGGARGEGDGHGTGCGRAYVSHQSAVLMVLITFLSWFQVSTPSPWLRRALRWLRRRV